MEDKESKMDKSQMSTPSSTDTEDWTMLDSSSSLNRSMAAAKSEPKIEKAEESERCAKKNLRKRLNSTRSDDTDGPEQETDEDSICVISESEDTHERIEEIRQSCDVADEDSVRSDSPVSEIEYEKQEEINSTPTTIINDTNDRQIVIVSPRLGMVERMRESITNNRTTISCVLVGLLAIGTIGFLSHAGTMVRTYNAQNEDIAKYHAYERKIIDLEAENYDLKLQVQMVMERLALVEASSGAGSNEGKVKEREPYPPSGSGRGGSGKRVKTKYDKFDRPPVAAGGEEETVVNVHVSPLEDLEWEHETQLKMPLPHEGSAGIEIETVDLSNFEPISVEVENRTKEGSPRNEYEQRRQEKVSKKERKEPDDKKQKEKRKSPERKQDKRERESKKKEDRKSEEYEVHKSSEYTEKFNKMEREDRSYSVKENDKGFKNNSREKEFNKKKKYHHDSDDDEDDDDDDDDEDDDDDSHEKKWKNKKHERQNSREHKNKYHSGEKRHDGSGSWHEKRMKYREEARKGDDNWYLNRKLNREINRSSHEKDNWYIERNNDRRHQRSEGSAERYK